jgi:hypothetical protein
MPSAQSQPVQSEIDELTAAIWDGTMGEVEFFECALEAGMSLKEIEAILEEIRNEDLA